MSSLTPVSEALTVIANSFVAAAAVAGAIAAFVGLNTWKKQNIWQQDYALAKTALLRLRKRSDAFHSLRNPFVSKGEMISALPDAELERGTDYAWAAAMNKRIEKLRTEVESTYPVVVEASAIWGNCIEDSFSRLDEIEKKVLVALVQLDDLKQRETRGVTDYEVAFRKLAFESSDDPTKSEYEKSANWLLQFFAQKLGRQ